MNKLNIAVLYGGRSVEHEVSVITALQVMHNLDKINTMSCRFM